MAHTRIEHVRTNLFSISGTTSVVLKEVKVPNLVKNGTREHVILDCIYSLNHSEKDGMILKWYFNGKTIFQWIPPSKPKVRFFLGKDYSIDE